MKQRADLQRKNGTKCLSGVAKPLTSRPSSSKNAETVAEIREIFRSDRRMTIRTFSRECGFSRGPCQKSSPKETFRTVPEWIAVILHNQFVSF